MIRIALSMPLLVFGLINVTASESSLAFLEANLKAQQSNGTNVLRVQLPRSLIWDSLDIIGPYTSVDDLPPVPSIAQAVEAYRINERDDIALLVFQKDHRIVEVVPFPRRTLDFATLAGQTMNSNQCLNVEKEHIPSGITLVNCK